MAPFSNGKKEYSVALLGSMCGPDLLRSHPPGPDESVPHSTQAKDQPEYGSETKDEALGMGTKE